MSMKRETAYEQLKERLATINDLGSVQSLLLWDQQTYMPGGAVAGRAAQLSTLSKLSHEMLGDAETEWLLDSSGGANPSSEEGALIRQAGRDYDRAAKMPAELVARTS